MIALARRLPVLLALIIAFVCIAPASADGQSLTVSCDTPPNQHDSCDRWYTTAFVTLDWEWDPPAAPLSGCDGTTFTAEGVVQRHCTVQWPGTTISKTVWIGIDRTPPELVGLQPSRPISSSGWFTGPVQLTFLGRDETSGVAACSSTTYDGPEGSGIPITGSCTDVAGNLGLGSLPINYDATPPKRPRVKAIPGNRRVRLRWRSVPGAEAIVERRTARAPAKVVYRGPGHEFVDKRLRNRRRYRYLVSLVDQAGNRTVGEATAVPTASRLLLPAHGARLSRPPTLVWKPVRGARYYNVQLIRGRKVLSRWPTIARLRLRRSWVFQGRRHRLVPGRYCWRVWPGLGPRSQNRYGRMLGSSCFRIV